MIVGYHASHEQHAPDVLLGHVEAAAAAGLTHAMCSDHFAPFLPEQGESGFTWTWLGAALQATGPAPGRRPASPASDSKAVTATKDREHPAAPMTMGTVSAPGYRYHPAVIAQAAATCAAMFPGRFWLALGSGEALNEHITGSPWPPKEERDARWLECAKVIRDLLDGHEVTHRGRVTVDRARLWSRPALPPRLLAAAISPGKAALAATWADGLITASQPDDVLGHLVATYRDAGGRGRLVLQAQVAWDEDPHVAREAALSQWRMGAIEGPFLEDLETPEAFAAACRGIGLDDLKGVLDILAGPEDLAHRLVDWEALGFDEVYLHNVAPDQRGFIETVARVAVAAQ